MHKIIKSIVVIVIAIFGLGPCAGGGGKPPVPTTTVPGATTTLPEATTTLPEATTTLPEATTTLPEATTTLPEATTTVPAASTVEVTAADFEFIPNTATATAGLVNFDIANTGAQDHTFTITSAGVDIALPAGSTGNTGSATLAAGTYDWFCVPHPFMTGVLTVS